MPNSLQRTVEIWHANPSDYLATAYSFKRAIRSRYTKVGAVQVPDNARMDVLLEAAYQAAQNVSLAWNQGATRSTVVQLRTEKSKNDVIFHVASFR
jgi:hypothetical protein